MCTLHMTGAPVLTQLLQLHPDIFAAQSSDIDYDVHFLDRYYEKGVDWLVESE